MNGFVRISQRKLNIYNEPGISGPSGGDGNGYHRACSISRPARATPGRLTRSSILGRPLRRVAAPTPAKTPPSIGGASMLDLYGITGLPTTSELTGGLTAQTLSGFTQLGSAGDQSAIPESAQLRLQSQLHQKHGPPRAEDRLEYVAIRTQVNGRESAVRPGFLRGRFQQARRRPGRCGSYSLADFLLRSAQRSTNWPLTAVGNYRQHEYFAYVQDDFRVNQQADAESGRALRIRHAALGTRQHTFELRPGDQHDDQGKERVASTSARW